MELKHQRNQIPTDAKFTHLRKVDRLYAYLQSISEWNGIPGESRFVSRGKYSPSEIGKMLDRTTRTVQRQMSKLKESGFVYEDDGKLFLVQPTVYTTVSPETLVALYQTSTDDVINVFAFLRWIYIAGQKKGRRATFVRSYILEEVLGLSLTGPNYTKIDNILNDIALKGLVELQVQNCTSPDGSFYKQYTVLKFSDLIAKGKITFQEEEALGTESVAEMTERLNQERSTYYENPDNF